jgi:ribosome-associated protein
LIQVTPAIAIDEVEIETRFIQASGPGGQNVNKVATAVQLRFNVCGSPSLPQPVRARLAQLAGQRLTTSGVLVITARTHRSQERNRQEALERLITLIRQAAQPPRPRRATRPSAAEKRRRLESKGRRGQLKRLRRQPPDGG